MGVGSDRSFLSFVKRDGIPPNDMTTSSAPGKIILFGEHAVVYGRPALAVPVTQVHVDVEVLDSARAGIWIDAPDIELHAELNTLPSDHPIASVIHNFLFISRVSTFPNLDVKISSTIPVASGLGSGAAVTVALTRALSAHINHAMTDEEVNEFTYEIEKLHHGTPSGIDNTVVTHAKPVYFVKGLPIELFKVGHPFTIVIGDTGISAPTKESVGDVRKLWEADKERWESVFDRIGEIACRSGANGNRKRHMDNARSSHDSKPCAPAGDDRLLTRARQVGLRGGTSRGFGGKDERRRTRR